MTHSPAERRHGEIEAALAYRFQDKRLLDEALTHASVVRGVGKRPQARRRSYQRLEFLGDRVLGLIVAHLLIERFPNDAEGALTHRQVALVQKRTLAEVAAGLGLERWLKVAAGDAEAKGRLQPALLADSCEALIGALYLDGGLEAARAFVVPRWRPLIETMQAPPRDAKMMLQEWAQARVLERPAYRVVATSGPPHATTFTVEVALAGQPPLTATGSSKRAAERAAARRMLEQLKEGPHG